jgi:hypothetical protein
MLLFIQVTQRDLASRLQEAGHAAGMLKTRNAHRILMRKPSVNIHLHDRGERITLNWIIETLLRVQEVDESE